MSAVSSGSEAAFCGIPEPSRALCTETVAPSFSVNKKFKMFRENLALPREPKCTTDDDELSTATVFSWRRQERGARQ